VDIDDLASTLPDYSDTIDATHLPGELRMTIHEVESTPNGISCVLRYDVERKRGAREDEIPWYKETVNMNLRFVEDLFSGGMLAIGSEQKRTGAMKYVAELLGTTPNECQAMNIPSTAIARIVGQDSADATFGWWKNIDEYTLSASVTGDIEDSTHANRINSKGEPTWVIFLSEEFGLKVGISRNSVVFYGNGWEHEIMENYILTVVGPILGDYT
jgi:hypothetical protein